MDSGSPRFFVSGRINVRRPPIVALIIKMMFGRFEFMEVINRTYGTNTLPIFAMMTQTLMQVDRITVGKVSEA